MNRMITHESLEQAMERSGTFSPEAAIRLIHAVAHQVAHLHKHSRRLHGAIRPCNILIDEQGHPELMTPDGPIDLGGANLDLESCPPELQLAEAVTFPCDLATASDVLRKHGARIDPERIDVYQLGVLFWHISTGELLADYLSSPRAKAKIPIESQRIIDQALGFDSAARWTRVQELLSAVDILSAPRKVTLDDTTPHLTGVGAPDTATSASRKPLSAQEELPFSRLGHYRILSRIGQGGMGDVYRGFEESLQRTVAIKVLPAELARHPDFVQRFRAEASAIAKVVHPHIVHIFYIGEDAGHHFFAMQFVEGESLGDLLSRRKKLSISETLTILEHVLRGLSAAHANGLIHRDIKPANILLEAKSGHALLADFGLVKSVDENARFTATGVVMGTVDYLSPEQARGANVDSRTDLYAIGVLAYQMFSGALPFVADSPTAMIFQHVYEAPRPLQELAPEIPDALVALVTTLLAKSPQARPQTADEVLAALQAYRLGMPAPDAVPVGTNPSAVPFAEVVPEPTQTIIKAPLLSDPDPIPLPDWEPAQTVWWVRARNRVLGRMQAVAPELAEKMQNTQQWLGGALAEYQRRREQLEHLIREAESVIHELDARACENRLAAENESQIAQQSTDPHTAESARQRQLECDRAEAELQHQLAAQIEQLETMKTKLARVSATLAQLRSQRDVLGARLKVAQAQISIAQGPRTRRRPILLLLSIGIVGGLVMTVLLAYLPGMLRQAGRSVVRSLPTLPTLPTVPVPVQSEPLYSQGFDPITRQSTERIDVPELTDEVAELPLKQFIGHQATVNSIAVHPKSSIIATASSDWTVRLWDAVTGRELKTLRDDPYDAYFHVAFSPDGQLVAASTYPSMRDTFSIIVWNAATGEVVQRMAKGAKVGEIAFHPMNRTLANMERSADEPNFHLHLRNYDTGESQGSIEPPGLQIVSSIAFSPDGKLLAFAAKDQGIALWDMENKEIKTMIRSESLPGHEVSFSADGRLLVVAGTVETQYGQSTTRHPQVELWDVASQKRVAYFTSPEEGYLVAVRLGAGQQTLAVSTGRSIQLWDVRQAKIFKVLRSHRAESLEFDRTGMYLLSGGAPASGPAVGTGAPYLLLWDAYTGR